MLNVMASLLPNECKTESAATAGEIPDAFTEEDELHAKRAAAEVARDTATNKILTFTWVRTVKNGELNYWLCCRPSVRSRSGQRYTDDI